MQARIASEQGRHVFLTASLVQREEWAKRCLQHGATEVSEVDDILHRLRTPGQPHRDCGPRDQLTLGLT